MYEKHGSCRRRLLTFPGRVHDDDRWWSKFVVDGGGATLSRKKISIPMILFSARIEEALVLLAISYISVIITS